MQNQEIYHKIFNNISQVIKGQSGSIRKLLAAFFTGGHVLLEDVPGTGKTTMAKALARSINAGYQRIQFTPDLLPTDILGVSIYNPRDQKFSFHDGPVFTNILLADEINRASPRTQSALLEAMAESQVSIDGQLRPLEKLFFVIATQNPGDFHGTYPLPEAQMDRFAMRFSLGYVEHGEEINILTEQNIIHPLNKITSVVNKEDVISLKDQISRIRISEDLKDYIVRIIRATRDEEGIINGASPRASLALMKTAQALALFDGLEFITPDHIQEIALPVISHRLKLDSKAYFSGKTAEDIVNNILHSIPAPV